MAERPWMPLWVGSYLKKTQHLTTLQHGVYFLLIMHYWSNDGLPKDDKNLARISRLSNAQWRSVKSTIAPFFDADWRHERIDEEIKLKRQVYGAMGGRASRGKSNVTRFINHHYPRSKS